MAEKQSKTAKNRHEILVTGGFFAAVFAVLIVYLGYVTATNGQDIIRKFCCPEITAEQFMPAAEKFWRKPRWTEPRMRFGIILTGICFHISWDILPEGEWAWRLWPTII